MKSTLTILIIFFCSSGFNQEQLPIYGDTLMDKNLLQLNSNNYYSSNRFSNDLTDKFIFGGFISEDIKETNSQRLSSNNRIGGEAEQSIIHFSPGIHPIKNERFGLVMAISDNHLITGNLPTDLFNIGMYGNANFQNDTLNFGFAHFHYLHYQKFGVGIYDKNTFSSVKLNYVSGSKAIEGRLNNSWMYNASDSLLLNLQGAGYRTDRFYPYLGFQGAGFAVDVNYNLIIDSKQGRKHFLNLQVNNLGFIAWNRLSHQYAIDSTTRYDGFNVNDFINQDDETTRTFDFIDTLGLYTGQGRNFITMPIEFVLQKAPIRNSGQKFQYLLGIKTILTSDYFPYLFVGGYYEPITNFSASTRLAYGGFGGVQWALNFNYWLKNSTYFSLGTFNLIGNISKSLGFGRSINFSAHFRL